MVTPPSSAQRSRSAVWLVGPVVCIAAASVVASALTPPLLAHHPLVLVVLSPRNRNLVATAPFVAALPFFVAALVARFAADPFLYLLGRRYGIDAVRWVEARTGAAAIVVRVLDRAFRRAAWFFVFFFPGGLVCVLAGSTGMAPKTFVLLDLAGTVTIVATLRIVGHEVAGPVDVVRRFLSRNLVWTTAVTIALALVWSVRRWRRFRAGAGFSAGGERRGR